MAPESRPHVEVAAVIQDSQGRVVIGKRKGKHGAGLYEFPGGNLDYGEDFFTCVQREVREETGLKVRAKKVVGWTNDIFKEQNKHEVTFYVVCEREDESQEPELKEPEKCEGWEWKAWKDVACMGEVELFLPTFNFVRSEPEW